MENQHRKISGYRELSQPEIDLMNQIKAKGEELKELISGVRAHISSQYHKVEDEDLPQEHDRLVDAQPERWAAIGATHLQEGLMALTRAVAQPTTF